MVDDYKPFKCQMENCPDYLIHPICHNHAHIYCEQYSNEKAVNEFLNAYRSSQGFEIVELNDRDISNKVNE